MSAKQQPYQYGQRQVIRRTKHSLFIGNGQLGGVIAAFLGIMSFLAVLCFYFPTYLTNAEFRASYDPEQLKWLLKAGIIGCFVFAGINFMLRKRRKLALVGVLYALLALILGAWNIEYEKAATNPYSLGLDWFILTFLGSATVGIGMEKLLPKYRKQQILRKYWRLDFAYFVLNHLILSAYILIGTGLCGSLQWALLPSFQQWVQSLPGLVQFLFIVLLADFCLYSCHRAFHSLPKLWGFHAVHHSCENMDWLAGSRSHFVYNVVERSMMMFVLAFVGAEQSVTNSYIIFAAIQAVVIHMNCDLPLGPLKLIIVSPHYHHWHHASDAPAIDTNFAAHTTLFDRLFNSYHFPQQYWPKYYGTTKPLPKTLIQQFCYPFKRLLP